MNKISHSTMADAAILGAALLQSEIELSKTLPHNPAPVRLEGQRVILRKLDSKVDGPQLYQVSNGNAIDFGKLKCEKYDPEEIIWRYLAAGPFATYEDYFKWQHSVETSDRALPFCVSVKSEKKEIPVGVILAMNCYPEFLRMELGNIWYSPCVQRTGINQEAIYLLLHHFFALGYRRIEWKCNALNKRSREAALKLGFTFEAIQEQHMISKGRNRDTAWFRMLKSEWENNLEERLKKIVECSLTN